MTIRSWTRPLSDAPSSDSLFPDALPDDALFLGTSPRTVALARHGDRPEADWQRVDVFTPDWNLRLRRLGAQVRFVAAGPVPGTGAWGDPDAEEQLGGLRMDTHATVLWGRRNVGESFWLELRVPHLMTPETHQHPAGHGAEHTDEMVRRMLTVTTYTDPETEVVRFQRLTGLQYAVADADDTTLDTLQ